MSSTPAQLTCCRLVDELREKHITVVRRRTGNPKMVGRMNGEKRIKLTGWEGKKACPVPQDNTEPKRWRRDVRLLRGSSIG